MNPVETASRKWNGLKNRYALGKNLEKKNTVLMLGTPEHRNIGDSAIALAQKLFLEKLGFSVEELSFTASRKLQFFCLRHLRPENPVVLMGGGNMGDVWPEEEQVRQELLSTFRDHPLFIFPQTLFYQDQGKARASSAVYEACRDLCMAARESVSMELMRSLYPSCRILLTPDIVLSMDPAAMAGFSADELPAADPSGKGILLCLRSDCEKELSSDVSGSLEQAAASFGLPVRKTDMIAEDWIGKSRRQEWISRKFREFQNSRLVVTDRLHGMIFAAMSSTPCLVLGNNHHKVEGTWQWLKDLPYVCFVQDPRDAADVMGRLLALSEEECHYEPAAFQQLFAELAELLRGHLYN